MATEPARGGGDQATQPVNWDNIPEYLREQQIWTVWKATAKGDGRFGKEPWKLDGSGRLKWGNPANLSTLEQVKNAFLKEPRQFDGIGFVVPPREEADLMKDGIDEHLVVIDLDDVFDDGGNLMKPEAKAIAGTIRSYTEISPSGNGLHIISTAKLPLQYRRNLGQVKINGQSVEIFIHTHFVTFTGNRLQEYPSNVEARDKEVAALYEKLLALQETAKEGKAKKPARGEGSKPTTTRVLLYCQKALKDEVNNVKNAREGERNNTLNKAAIKIGHYVGAQILSRSEVESELQSAAMGAGLDKSEARATINSGLEAGIREPKTPDIKGSKAEIDKVEQQKLLKDATLSAGQENHLAPAGTGYFGLVISDFGEWKKVGKEVVFYFDTGSAARAILSKVPLRLSSWEVGAREPKPDIWTCMNRLWTRDGEHLIETLCDDIAGKYSTRNNLIEVKRRVVNALRDEPVNFDTGNPHLVGTANGFSCDLITGEVRETSHDDYISQELRLPVNYDPDATCPETFRFYDNICATDCEKQALIDADVAMLDQTSWRGILERFGGGANGKAKDSNRSIRENFSGLIRWQALI